MQTQALIPVPRAIISRTPIRLSMWGIRNMARNPISPPIDAPMMRSRCLKTCESTLFMAETAQVIMQVWMPLQSVMLANM